MGLIFDQMTFDGQAPRMTRLADKITQISGLQVLVIESDAKVTGTLYDQHAHLAFACVPEERLQVFSYRPGEVRKVHDEMFDGLDLPIAKAVTGLNEPPGTQAIYLRGYADSEPTLFMVTVLALEALGGRPSVPIDEEVRLEFGKPISEAEFQERRRKLQKKLRLAVPFQVLLLLLLLPITIPLFILSIFSHLLRLPWILHEGRQIAADAISKRDHQKLLGTIPDLMEYAATTVEAYPELDIENLQRYTQELQSVGFEHAIDFALHTELSSMSPGFARLFIHPEHRCYAEVDQVFPWKSRPTAVRCLIGSLLEDGWDLTTTDRVGLPLFYAWRRPRGVWSRHPHDSPGELAEHLCRRKRIMETMRLAVVPALSSEQYFAHSKQNMADRKALLSAKSIETIRSEMKAYERYPVDVWAGELPAHCCGAPPPSQ